MPALKVCKVTVFSLGRKFKHITVKTRTVLCTVKIFKKFKNSRQILVPINWFLTLMNLYNN